MCSRRSPRHPLSLTHFLPLESCSSPAPSSIFLSHVEMIPIMIMQYFQACQGVMASWATHCIPIFALPFTDLPPRGVDWQWAYVHGWVAIPDEEVSHGEIIQAAGKEGQESVEGDVDHRLARHIQACGEDARDASELIELVDDLPVFGLNTRSRGLNPERMIRIRGP